MIRKIYRASGTTPPTTTTTTSTTTTNSGPSDGALITNQVLETGGEIATSLLSEANPMAWIGDLIGGVTNIFSGMFNLGATRNNNSAATEQIYWLTAKDRNDDTYKNTGFYIIVGLAVVAITLVIIFKNKK